MVNGAGCLESLMELKWRWILRESQVNIFPFFPLVRAPWMMRVEVLVGTWNSKRSEAKTWHYDTFKKWKSWMTYFEQRVIIVTWLQK